MGIRKVLFIDLLFEGSRYLYLKLNELECSIVKAMDLTTGLELLNSINPQLIIISFDNQMELKTFGALFENRRSVLAFAKSPSPVRVAEIIRFGFSDILLEDYSSSEINEIFNRTMIKSREFGKTRFENDLLNSNIPKNSFDTLLEQTFTLFMNHLPASVFIKDSNSKYLYVNNSMKELFGDQKYEGSYPHELFDDDFAKGIEREDRLVLDQKNYTFEKRVLHKGEEKFLKGIKFIIERDDYPTLIGGIAFDITDTKMVVEASKKLIAAVEYSYHSVIICDSDGKIEYANRRFSEVTQYSNNELIGNKPSILKSGEQDSQFYSDMWDTLSAGKVWKGQLVNRKKDGSIFYEDASIFPLFNNKKIVNYVGIKKDITKEIELEEQLKQSQKMEAIGTLAGGIAHDINNILSIIHGNSFLLLKTMEKGKLRDKISDIFNASLRMQKLTKRILSFSHKKVNDAEVIHLGSHVEETLRLIKSTMPKSIVLRRKINSVSMVKIGQSDLQQVVMNLCTNAIYSMSGKKGVLHIGVEDYDWDQFDNSIRYMLPVKDCNYVKLSIEDNGSGIPDEIRKKIFDPYFTTKGKMGTGIGLSIVHGVIKSSNGTISVNSKVGIGTKFEILFPVEDRSSIKVDQHSSMESSVVEPKTILLIDDEVNVVKSLQEILEFYGHKVYSITDSRLAIKEIESSISKYDLVISDMSMPNYTGVDIARVVNKRVPLIIYTGYSSKDEIVKAEEFGVKTILHKPIETKQLLKQIDLLTN